MSYDLFVYRTPAGEDPTAYFDEMSERFDAALSDDPELSAMCEEFQTILGDYATCSNGDGRVEINVTYNVPKVEQEGMFQRLEKCIWLALSRGLSVYEPQEGRAIDPKRDMGRP